MAAEEAKAEAEAEAMELEFPYQPLNVDLLRSQLLAAGLPAQMIRVVDNVYITIGFEWELTVEQIVQLNAIMAAHDSSIETPDQAENRSLRQDAADLALKAKNLIAQLQADLLAINEDISLLETAPTNANALAVLRKVLERQGRQTLYLMNAVKVLRFMIRVE